jgi:hypothetical protein
MNVQQMLEMLAHMSGPAQVVAGGLMPSSFPRMIGSPCLDLFQDLVWLLIQSLESAATMQNTLSVDLTLNQQHQLKPAMVLSLRQKMTERTTWQPGI